MSLINSNNFKIISLRIGFWLVNTLMQTNRHTTQAHFILSAISTVHWKYLKMECAQMQSFQEWDRYVNCVLVSDSVSWIWNFEFVKSHSNFCMIFFFSFSCVYFTSLQLNLLMSFKNNWSRNRMQKKNCSALSFWNIHFECKKWKTKIFAFWPKIQFCSKSNCQNIPEIQFIGSLLYTNDGCVSSYSLYFVWNSYAK